MESSPATEHTVLSVTVLSDNSSEVALLQHVLALSRAPRCQIQSMAYSYFDARAAVDADLVFLSHNFGNRSIIDTLNRLVETSHARLPRVLVLLDEESLAATLPYLADAARMGVQDYLLTSELSLKQILHAVSGHSTPIPFQPTSQASSQPATQTNSAHERRSPDIITERRASVADEHPPETVTMSQTRAEASATSSTPLANRAHQIHQLSIDIEHQRVHLGLRAESLLGYESSGIFTIGEWLRLLDTQGAGEFRQLLDSASTQQRLANELHCEIRAQNGTAYPVEIAEIQWVENNAGTIVGANAQLVIGEPLETPASSSAATTENSDQYEAFGALEEQANEWHDIAHSLPLSCLLLDDQGMVVRVIRGDHSTASAFPDAREGQAITEILGIESPDNYAGVIAKTLNTGKPHQQTLNVSTPQGMRWYDSHITKLRGNHGLSRQVLWTAFDITPARHAYQELLKNHDALTDMLNDAPVLFCQKDAAGRYQRVNRAFCETFNVRAEVIAGRKDEEMFSGPTLEQLVEADEHIAQQGGESYYNSETVIDGQNQTIHWHKFALKSHTSNNIESITAFGFITGDALAATDANNNVGVLPTPTESGLAAPTGAIGQDFKMIISSIVNYTELAMAQRKSGREHRLVEYLNQVVSASERARDMILQSPDKEGVEKSRQAVELKPLVKEIVQMLQPTLPTTLKFQTDLENANGKAEVDPVHFQRIVMQLLVSARDSSDQNDEIMLRLSNSDYTNQQCVACHSPIDGSHIVLTVETRSGNINPDGLQKMIDAASRAVSGKESRNSNNIIIMTHDSDGHVLINHQKKTIALHLLFKRVPGRGRKQEPVVDSEVLEHSGQEDA